MTAGPRVATPPPLRWDGTALHLLDQTRLPGEEVVITLSGADDTAAAIKRLAVRGAPLIGVAAAYGLAMEVARTPTEAGLERGAAVLAGARPTARNLGWAVERVVAAVLARPDDVAAAARAEAEAIHREDEAASAALARHGADALDAELPPGPVTVMTHCNTGALAAVTVGTALGVVLELHRRGALGDVIASETRPLLQGARLTAWELSRAGVGFRVAVDGAGPFLMARGEVDAVVVGADRICANGDTVNKIGTYAHALGAHRAGIPFLVVAPESTIDRDTPEGAAVPIEDRAGDEVNGAFPAANPAFDVTPHDLITAIVTDRRVIHPHEKW